MLTSAATRTASPACTPPISTVTELVETRLYPRGGGCRGPAALQVRPTSLRSKPHREALHGAPRGASIRPLLQATLLHSSSALTPVKQRWHPSDTGSGWVADQRHHGIRRRQAHTEGVPLGLGRGGDKLRYAQSKAVQDQAPPV